MIERQPVAGLPVASFSTERLAEHVVQSAEQGRPLVYVFVNAYSASLRRQSPEYQSLLGAADVVPVADGASLSVGAKLIGRAVERAPGPDVLETVCELAASSRLPVYLLGGAPGTAAELGRALAAAHEGLIIAGTHSPPYGSWSEDSTAEMVGLVRESSARLLVLGVSAPKQETWSAANLSRLGMPVLCVGAAFDFLSGNKPRAPRILRTLGLEWLFRLASEPRRLWRRYLAGNAVFLYDLTVLRNRPAPTLSGAADEDR